MFARIYTSSLLLFIAVCASAAVLPRGGVNQCNTGTIQCCNSVQNADDPLVGGLASLLGIDVDISGQVGVTCNPVSVLGGFSGVSCSAQPVCCTGNSFNGVVVVGCSPINVNI